MDKKDFLTTEALSKRFISPFDLVNYAIRLAENAIKTGRAMRVTSDSQNLAQELLLEIVHNRDTFEEVIDEVPEQEIAVTVETVAIVEKTKGKVKQSRAVAKA